MSDKQCHTWMHGTRCILHDHHSGDHMTEWWRINPMPATLAREMSAVYNNSIKVIDPIGECDQQSPGIQACLQAVFSRIRARCRGGKLSVEFKKKELLQPQRFTATHMGLAFGLVRRMGYHVTFCFEADDDITITVSW